MKTIFVNQDLPDVDVQSLIRNTFGEEGYDITNIQTFPSANSILCRFKKVHFRVRTSKDIGFREVEIRKQEEPHDEE